MNGVSCSFIGRCKNHPKECHHCKWNSNADYGDYLIIENEEGKTIRLL